MLRRRRKCGETLKQRAEKADLVRSGLWRGGVDLRGTEYDNGQQLCVLSITCNVYRIVAGQQPEVLSYRGRLSRDSLELADLDLGDLDN
ncbi:hypothetical protein PAXRUDRAFT_22578 [Paxillus rubicundulus Ve08.2h10]|uniref:Unplaced genomic scaffold scaffold_6590, whole genome shotgun sequence n=1 Tax=Paxillus rubicundulus Ve08.2h10 TaxID=930991 RepID=A0A0D0CMX8_9AGAM|nr:hypothetical protein PAXRUDRAFT_22578 [Paxillus rubicundulus Ve08.2h10]